MSIDNTPNDSALDCVTVKYAASPYCHFHDSVSRAFLLLRMFPNRALGNAVLIGHGSPGVINCGLGKIFTNVPSKYIGLANVAHWRIHARRGIRAKHLILSGCHTGQGTNGAKLLNLLAASLRIPVSAWTGLVWCTPAATWGGGRFVTARPSAPATPAPWTPLREFLSTTESLHDIRLAVEATRFVEISSEKVLNVQLMAVESSELGISAVALEGVEIQEVLRLVDFSHPLVTQARPTAIMTGQLKVSYVAEGGIRTRTFRVLGPSIIQDEEFEDIFYFTSPGLNNMIIRQHSEQA